MSDRSQELLDAEAVSAAAQAAEVEASPNPVPEPPQPVVTPNLAPLGPFLRLTGTATSTSSSTTLVFTIPTGMAPAAGNTLVVAVANVNTTPFTIPFGITDSRFLTDWSHGDYKQGFSTSGPTSGLFYGLVADLRDGDTITATFSQAITAKMMVIAEYISLNAVGTFGKVAGNGTSIDTGSGGFASYEVGTRAVCASIAYAGTQSLPQAYELVNFERFQLRGRASAGVHTVDLWDYEVNTTGAYRVFGTLNTAADWAVASSDWKKQDTSTHHLSPAS